MARVSAGHSVLAAWMSCILLGISSVSAHADTASALQMITDTANRLCGIVAVSGESSSEKVNGDVKAELNGLAKRLANIGISGAGQINSKNYQGLVQEDLPSALKDQRDCNLKVFATLQNKVLPNSPTLSSPGAPTPALLETPILAHMTDTVSVPNYGFGRFSFGFYSCANKEDNITCYVLMKRLDDPAIDYSTEKLFKDPTKLIDNFRIEHRIVRAYFINGVGSEQPEGNLAKDDDIWVGLEFGKGPRDISTARIILSAFQNAQLRGPVK